MGQHLIQYQHRMHTLLISNELRKSKLNYWPCARDTLHRVLQECGGYIDGRLHVSYCYWETPRIGMTCHGNGSMICHLIPWWILRYSDSWERHFCQCLSTNQQCIPNLMKKKHQMRHYYMSLNVIKAPCLVHLRLKGGAILSSARLSSLFEVVAHKVVCWKFEYIRHVCSNCTGWGWKQVIWMS